MGYCLFNAVLFIFNCTGIKRARIIYEEVLNLVVFGSADYQVVNLAVVLGSIDVSMICSIYCLISVICNLSQRGICISDLTEILPQDFIVYAACLVFRDMIVGDSVTTHRVSVLTAIKVVRVSYLFKGLSRLRVFNGVGHAAILFLIGISFIIRI